MSNPARALVQPGDGQATWFLGHLFVQKVSSEDTGGVCCVLEHLVAPLPAIGAPPHAHHREDEAWYILEGRLAFVIEGRPVEAGPGSVVIARKGQVHSFNNPGPGPARCLVMLWPAGFERFFFELGEPADRHTLPPMPPGPPDMGRMLEAAGRYALEFTP